VFRLAAERVHARVVALGFHSGAGMSSGTGTMITDRGLILTANHVIPEAAGYALVAGRNYSDDRVPLMQPTRFEVVERYPEFDLALMRCQDLPLDGVGEPVEFQFDRLHPGTALGSFGYPQPILKREDRLVGGKPRPLISVIMYLKFKSYFVAGVGRPDFDVDAGPHQFVTYQLDSFAYGGHSGGPVFDVDGRIVAVMSLSYLKEPGGYEVSYCDAVGVENIRDELATATASA